MQSKNHKTSYQLREIPQGIWKKFKIRCMEDNLPTLQHGIMALIEKYVKGKVKLD
tara:strand:+ start:128 stop:292 length:165 start_codon:yes stop_codon:yes gene_type:complete